MSQLTIDNATMQVIPHGLAMKYSTEEINAITDLRHFTEDYQKRKSELAWKLYQVKLQLDGDDAAEGRKQFGGDRGAQGGPSRFWQAIESGDLGDFWQAKGRSTIKDSLQAVQQALAIEGCAGRSPATTNPPAALALSTSALIKYGQLSGDALELANLSYRAQNFVSEKYLRSIERLCNRYPTLIDEVKEGIQFGRYKVPDDVDGLMDRYQRKLDADSAAQAERKRIEREAQARTATEAQVEADRKLAEELESELPDEPADAPVPEQGKPPEPPSDEPKILTTYPVQELLDGTAFEGLQKRYDRDTADFFADMRELYTAVRKVDEITDRWAERLQDEHLSGHKQEMLLWETYSVAWNRLGKFKKLGGSKINSVPQLWQMIGELAQRAKGATARCITYSQLNQKKYGPFKVAETSSEHYQPGRVDV